MISSELRNRKARLISNIGYEAACAYQNSHFDAARVYSGELSALNLAYQDVDRDLFWFSIYVSRMVGEFMASEGRNFAAFAMLKACQAFQGLQLDESDEQPEEQSVHHLTPEAAAENFRLAGEWRSESGYTPLLTGGYVIVCSGQVSGWIAQLRDANHWEPGVIAVGVRGSQYKAVGGDPYNGAESWQLVSTTQCLNGAAA